MSEVVNRRRFLEAANALVKSQAPAEQETRALFSTLSAVLTDLAGEHVQVIADNAPKLAHGHRTDYALMTHARRIGEEPISSIRRMPNWVLAMELFGTGSNSAHQICRDAGIDPDSTKVERVPPRPAQPTRQLTHCAAARDGECSHPGCPQIRDGEPAASGRHCPLDQDQDET